jgi:PAS domain-containing protein
VYVNHAFESLTGYSSSDAVGRNCRFLQGAKTEVAAVAELVECVRERRPKVVKLTNYTKDGHEFVNALSTHPVHDSNGVCRYMIGVQCKGAATTKDRAMLAAIRHLLPAEFPASLNSKSVREVRAFDVLNSSNQYDETVLQLVRLSCLDDIRGSLEACLRYPTAERCFCKAMPNEKSRHQLKLVFDVARMAALTGPKKVEAARAIYHELLMPPGGEKEYSGDVGDSRLIQRLKNERDAAVESLANESFFACLESTAMQPILKAHSESFGSGSFRALWSEWCERSNSQEQMDFTTDGGCEKQLAPLEVSGWLRAFMQMFDSFSLPICLSDMSLSGNPLIYVNASWTLATGYPPDEVLGSNCRFLQGPKTDEAAVVRVV